MEAIYVLMEDRDGTLRSKPEPFGVAVTNEDEAKGFVAKATPGYSRSYQKLVVFKTEYEAMKFAWEKVN